MIKQISYKDTVISYDLQYKNVKNINLRIKSDGKVYVSANKRISEDVINGFVLSKIGFIIKAINHYSSQEKIKYFDEQQLKNIITDLCYKIYPYFRDKGVAFPKIKFRKMTSRWGSCHTQKGVLTFNTNLMYAPIECIEYVVFHEFTHFIWANHSKQFYIELEKICPNWKTSRNKLKNIKL